MPSGHGKDVPRRIGCMSVPQKRLRRWLPERAVAVRLEATTKGGAGTRIRRAARDEGKKR